MIPTDRKPTHPGEMLLHEFLKPMKLTQMELASRMGVPVQRINTLINGKRDMTAETAILLSRVLKTTPEFWMNLQGAYDLHEAKLRLSLAPVVYKTVVKHDPTTGDIVADERRKAKAKRRA